MWLVIGSASDSSALWAYQGLKARNLDPIILLTPQSLVCSLRWNHRVGTNGATIEITLADGQVIGTNNMQGVLNRLSVVPIDHLQSAPLSERDYASQELSAFFMSWLYSLPCPVINRPTTQGLSGQWRPLSEWIWLAGQAGLPLPAFQLSSIRFDEHQDYENEWQAQRGELKTALVLHEHVLGDPIPSELVEGCRNLAKFSNTTLLGVYFKVEAGGKWQFAGASPIPDLRKGGQVFVDILLSKLLNGNR
jgi:hypothetical protein